MNKEEYCPKCLGKECKGVTDKAMIYQEGEPCPTYWNGCHCCDLCQGFDKCEHSKWASEDCKECENNG